MSVATTAMVLRAADANDGQWLRLDWLAERVYAPAPLVHTVCESLVERQQLMRGLVGGMQCYGVHVAEQQRAA